MDLSSAYLSIVLEFQISKNTCIYCFMQQVSAATKRKT
jgi:uncharacterized membrane protein